MSIVITPSSQPPVRSHRTPRYVFHRTRQLFYERAHPDDPWLTPAAIRLLAGLLSPADRGAEFGSGRSTLWFAARVAALTSVEHDERWHETVTAKLKDRGLGNVEYILAPEDQPMERGGDSTYARTAHGFPEAALRLSPTARERWLTEGFQEVLGTVKARAGRFHRPLPSGIGSTARTASFCCNRAPCAQVLVGN